jgi:phage terminase small subunit
MALTPKQKRFVEEYVVDFNGKAAAIRAGYSKRSAKVIASQLLANPEVAKAVKAATERVSEATRMTQEDVWRQWSAIANSDPGDVFDFSGESIGMRPAKDIPPHARRAISSIQIKRRTRVEGEGDNAKEVLEEDVKITFWDKPSTVKTVGQVLGMVKDKVEHSGYIETVTMTDEERAEAVANMLKTAAARKASQDGSGDGASGNPTEHAPGVQGGDGPDGSKPAASD